MITGLNDKNELTNVKVTNDGEVKVALGGVQTTESGAMKVNVENVNSTENGSVKVSIEENNVPKIAETTIRSEVLSVGIAETSIPINKKITEIDVANYSETSIVTLTIGELEAQVGNNLGITIPINKEAENISIKATEEGTQVQIVVKGVEENV